MSAENFEIDEAKLLAYADGALADTERAAVEAFLSANPAQAELVAQYRHQNEALHALFPSLINDVVPGRLRPRQIAARRKNQTRGWMQFAAAAMVLISVSGSAGWVMRGVFWAEPAASTRLIEGALAAHDLYVREGRHAVEVAASERFHLDTWLSSRIARPFDAPDLAAQGFTLIGGRLLPPVSESGAGPSAQLMYENASADRITVFLTGGLKPNIGRPYQMSKSDGLEAYYWADAGITCTVVGDLPEAEMQLVAKKVYQQLSWRPDATARG